MRWALALVIPFLSTICFSQAAPEDVKALPEKKQEVETEKPILPLQPSVLESQSKMPSVRRKRVDTSAMTAQVSALKAEVISAKTQMIILKDLLKKEGLDGSKRPLVITFKNDLSERYLIDTVTYKLNGEIIYQYVVADSQDLKPGLQGPQKTYETKVVPGPYNIEVQVVYRGNDTGVFSYLKDYRITRQSKLNLDVKKINSTQLSISTFESGRFFTDFKDRPQLQISRLD